MSQHGSTGDLIKGFCKHLKIQKLDRIDPCTYPKNGGNVHANTAYASNGKLIDYCKVSTGRRNSKNMPFQFCCDNPCVPMHTQPFFFVFKGSMWADCCSNVILRYCIPGNGGKTVGLTGGKVQQLLPRLKNTESNTLQRIFAV